MNNTKISLLVVLLALFAALAPGCSQPGYRVIQRFVPTTTAVTIGNDVLSFPRPLEMPPEAEKMYWLCVQDAKQNNECDPWSFDATSFEVVEFDDTSLGVPRRGVEYSKVITPGYIFEFDNGVDRYTYHTDTENRVVFVKKTAVR